MGLRRTQGRASAIASNARLWRVVVRPTDQAHAHRSQSTVCDSAVFSYITFVARDKLQILQGEPKGYKQPLDAAASGKQVIRYFCSDCGTPLWAAAESAPHVYTIKVALFGNNIPPGKEIYWKYAQRESLHDVC